jgi:hypothetical protein
VADENVDRPILLALRADAAVLVTADKDLGELVSSSASCPALSC